MKTAYRFGIAAGLMFLALASQAAFAQEGSPVVITGTWRWIAHEEMWERQHGPNLGHYWGIPLNDAARMRADTYNAEWIQTSALMQCRPRPTGHQPFGFDPVQIDEVVDPVSRQLVAYAITHGQQPGARMVWLDGRPRPSQYAHHSWEGFSTGKFKGDSLEITTTHLKENYVSRNGVPTSFRSTVIEQISLEEPYLRWTVVTIDPDYLTEPLVRSATYMRAPTLHLNQSTCQAVDDLPPGVKYTVPHFLPGENPNLTEVAVKYKVPVEGLRGGAETTYPEWRATGEKLPVPTAQFTLKPVYNDASTRIAALADAQPKRPPTYDKVDATHVAGTVYMLAGAGGNIAFSSGGDGVVLVDTGAAQASDKVLAAIRQVAESWKPAEITDSASRFADKWLGLHTFREPIIRMIVNTSANPDHVGGNASVRKSAMFRPLGGLEVVAHDNAANRLAEGKPDELSLPTSTYFAEKFTVFRFLNNEAVQVFHMKNAITDGDSAVWFRHSDVVVTGDVYNSDIYPPIDVDRGGSIEGEIESLNQIVNMSVTEFYSQGGTMIVPGHGWISDAADVGYYRDMMIIIRDRIQNLIDKGMTLEQVKAAKPTLDYDPEYGRQPGVTAGFVTAVYRSLKEKKSN